MEPWTLLDTIVIQSIRPSSRAPFIVLTPGLNFDGMMHNIKNNLQRYHSNSFNILIIGLKFIGIAYDSKMLFVI